MDSTAVPHDGNRLHALTGARFVAAFMVFLFHGATLQLFAPSTQLAGPLTQVTKAAGTIGVAFFFMLSGFVLTWSARPGDTYGSFLRRRLVKIYPNHLVMFAVAVALFAASTPPVVAGLNALLLHAWVPDPAVFLSVNGPSWSLSCELFFYALFPLLLPAVRRIAPARLWGWAAVVAGTVIFLPFVLQLVPAGPRFSSDFDGTVLAGEPVRHLWLLYAFPPVRLLDFVLGMLLARIVLAGRWINLGVAWAAALTALGYVVGLFTPMTFTVAAATVLPLALLIPALAVAETRGSRPPLAGRTMRRLGELSFAFYLVHQIVLVVLRAVVGFDRQVGPAVGILVLLAALAGSLALAYLLHRFVETPAVRRWGSATPVARTAVPAAAPDPVAAARVEPDHDRSYEGTR